MSDYEIGEEMYQTWMNEKIDVTSVPDKQIDKIKAQIENSIKEEKSNGFDFSRIIQIAATILLPVFIILSGYLRTDKLPPKKWLSVQLEENGQVSLFRTAPLFLWIQNPG